MLELLAFSLLTSSWQMLLFLFSGGTFTYVLPLLLDEDWHSVLVNDPLVWRKHSILKDSSASQGVTLMALIYLENYNVKQGE